MPYFSLRARPRMPAVGFPAEIFTTVRRSAARMYRGVTWKIEQQQQQPPPPPGHRQSVGIRGAARVYQQTFGQFAHPSVSTSAHVHTHSRLTPSLIEVRSQRDDLHWLDWTATQLTACNHTAGNNVVVYSSWSCLHAVIPWFQKSMNTATILPTIVVPVEQPARYARVCLQPMSRQ